MGFIDKPRRVWWRRAMFQVHLWAGIALCLYTVVIGITGSILVFESEIEHAAYTRLWHASNGSAPSAPEAAFVRAVEKVRHIYAGYQVTVAYPPDHADDNFELFVRRGDAVRYVFVDASTGNIVGDIDPAHSWLIWITDLHFHLLMGKTGLLLNGIGSAGLLVLCLSGIVIWWAGIRNWARGLKVNLHSGWKRINYDLHSVFGFWTLAIVFMWAFTGVYFVWPRPIESAVNLVSSVSSSRPPAFTVPPRAAAATTDLQAMIRAAEHTSPSAAFAGAFFPANNKAPLTLLMARGAQRNFSQMDYLYFDPSTGRQLAVWHRGVNTTWGSKFIFWLGPLHFGYYWGTAVEILWAAFGCALPLLAITSLIMYWNRYLGKRWKAARQFLLEEPGMRLRLLGWRRRRTSNRFI